MVLGIQCGHGRRLFSEQETGILDDNFELSMKLERCVVELLCGSIIVVSQTELGTE